MTVYNREKKELYEEKQYGRKKLLFLYDTVPGRTILRFFTSKAYSRHSAKANNKKKSTKKIVPFIKKYQINMNDYEQKGYGSFNDFFTRKFNDGKRPINPDEDALIAVADSKLLVYHVNADANIPIKNSTYTVLELIQDETLAKEYQNGLCLVFRLSVDDCHRYVYPDDGELIEWKEIDGVLHTVTPIVAKKYRAFCENYRVCSLILTKHFKEVMQIEIGALLVGKINNHEITQFRKGEEKGCFELGGSTIILLFKENAISIDEDIAEHSKQGVETKVKSGEKIGIKLC